MSKHQEIFKNKGIIHVQIGTIDKPLSFDGLTNVLKEKSIPFKLPFVMIHNLHKPEENEEIEILVIGALEVDDNFITFKAEFEQTDDEQNNDLFRVGVFYDTANNTYEAVFNDNSAPY